MENNITGMSKELYQFIKTLPDEKVADNVYEIICENKDGDITERKFGLNVFTDKAFSAEIVNNSNIDGEWTNYYGLRFVFGKGQGVPTSSDDELFDRIMEFPIFSLTTYGTDTGGNYSARRCPDNEYLNTFNPTLNAIIGRRMTGTVTMDYNYDSIDENINITEFGEYGASGGGTSDIDWNKKPMHTHCLVYDENHDPSYFTKRINEKVTVKIYRTNIVYCSIFNELWNQGKYLFINPMYMVRSPGTYSGDVMNWRSFVLMDQVSGRCRTEDDFPMYPTPYNCVSDSGCYGNTIGGGKNWGFGADGDMNGCMHIDTGMSQTYNASESDGYRNTGTFGATLYDNTIFPKCGLNIFHWNSLRNYYWHYNQHSGLKKHDWLFCIEKINQSMPETIQFDFAYTDDFLHPRFRNIFGLRPIVFPENGLDQVLNRTMLPVNDFNLTSVKLYNYKTDSYDIVEQFTNDANYDFRNPERGIWGRYSIPGFGTFDVHVNIHAGDIPIIGFNNPDSESLWMTDAYWDSSTFVKLEHNNTVPAALQHKRYIIKKPTTDAWFNSNGRDGMGGGIFPIREPNKHALIPSEQTIELNIEASQLSFSTSPSAADMFLYASDEGWIYYRGKLIYPESDDGTGNPYIYDLSVFNYAWVKYTHDRIVSINGDNYRIDPNSTDIAFKVYKIDPTHPEIDPNTTAVDYYERDIKFELTTSYSNTYIYSWCIFTVNEKTDHMIITRNTGILFVDLNNHTHNIDYLPNMTGFNNGLAKAAGMIYGTDNIIIYPNLSTDAANGVLTFWVYSLTDLDIVKTFTVDRVPDATMTMHGIFGYKDMVYLDIYISANSTHWIYMYNTSTDELVTKSGLFWSFTIDDNWIYKMNNVRSKIDFDDEVFFFCGKINDDNNYSNGCRCMAIFADDLTNPIYFENNGNNAYGSNYYMKSYSYVSPYGGLPRIGKFNDGKHLVMLFQGACNNYYNQYNTYVNQQCQNFILDLGYIKNKGYHTPQELCENIPSPVFRMPNRPSGAHGIQASSSWASEYRYDSNNAWFSEVAFYKGKVLVINTFGKVLLMPIDTFLPHQIIGTTRTVQAYNHPKYINAQKAGFVIDKYNEL